MQESARGPGLPDVDAAVEIRELILRAPAVDRSADGFVDSNAVFAALLASVFDDLLYRCGLHLNVKVGEDLPAVGLQREVGLQIRSEEHTSELQSRGHLVCRLLLEKKKKNQMPTSVKYPHGDEFLAPEC